ncbi:HEPN domain-containing protein [Natribacillus halophilus]|uniref:HEPN domain-containing protein n=1 Tax=Natribacillus halophilus TaxID=549003 RepID=A0A1G8LV71_9BACI|nr:HEPN domain-containing protein [Natribacillus halophilus]SDI59612.1 HEPN domain-containing protein [Natribacillus halophilus]
MNHKSVAEEWFSYARSDLEVAKFLKNMRPIPLEIICYHCQQSAEKHLKGYIAYNGGEIHRTHDLNILNKICTRYHQRFKELTDECIHLTDYGIQTRYPFELQINEEDMNSALKSATTIQKFVMRFVD